MPDRPDTEECQSIRSCGGHACVEDCIVHVLTYFFTSQQHVFVNAFVPLVSYAHHIYGHKIDNTAASRLMGTSQLSITCHKQHNAATDVMDTPQQLQAGIPLDRHG